MNILAIGAGGALGAILRYLLTNTLKHSQFITNIASPYAATPIINAIGCFIFALLINKFNTPPITSSLELFIFTGALAAFTTFSTFYFELFEIYQKYGATYSTFYLFTSLVISLIFFTSGIACSKYI